MPTNRANSHLQLEIWNRDTAEDYREPTLASGMGGKRTDFGEWFQSLFGCVFPDREIASALVPVRNGEKLCWASQAMLQIKHLGIQEGELYAYVHLFENGGSQWLAFVLAKDKNRRIEFKFPLAQDPEQGCDGETQKKVELLFSRAFQESKRLERERLPYFFQTLANSAFDFINLFDTETKCRDYVRLNIKKNHSFIPVDSTDFVLERESFDGLLTNEPGHSKFVSRKHLEILTRSLNGSQEQVLVIVDLNSTNGSWVNELCLTPFQPHILKKGDVIKVGQLELFVDVYARRREQYGF